MPPVTATEARKIANQNSGVFTGRHKTHISSGVAMAAVDLSESFLRPTWELRGGNGDHPLGLHFIAMLIAKNAISDLDIFANRRAQIATDLLIPSKPLGNRK